MDRVVTYTALAGDPPPARLLSLAQQRYRVAGPEEVAPDARILDGTDADASALDEAVRAAVEDGGAPVLAIFSVDRGTTFRDRQDALIRRGAAAAMQARGDDSELVTRLRALFLLSRAPTILVVEDEAETAAWVAEELGSIGMTCLHADTLAGARAVLESTPVDALIVDRGLHGREDGLDLVRHLRQAGIHTPAILYTAWDDIAQRIEGLDDARADDYLCKPAHADELRARVRLALRPRLTEDRLIFGPLDISRKDGIVRWRGERLEIRKRECDILVYLAARAGLPVPRRVLYQDIWHKVYMDPDSDPVAAAKHRLTKSLKAEVKARGDTCPDFLITDADAYLFDPAPLLRLDGFAPDK